MSKVVLNLSKMSLPQRKAYKAWKDQRQRCNNPKNPRFYCYGARGIKVRYSPRELIAWYEIEYAKRSTWNRPQIGRINHEKDYSLDNIELVECSDNVRERNARLGNPTPFKGIIQKDWKTGKELARFASIREASRELGITRKTIQNAIRKGLQRAPKLVCYFTKQP